MSAPVGVVRYADSRKEGMKLHSADVLKEVGAHAEYGDHAEERHEISVVVVWGVYRSMRVGRNSEGSDMGMSMSTGSLEM